MTEVLLKELRNSDINWMISVGQRREISGGTVLIHPTNTVDNLHILLDGTLKVTVPAPLNNPLSRAFAAIENNQSLGQEIARLYRGEVIGEIPLVSMRPSNTTVEAVEKSLIMSISLSQLTVKLQQDVGFAARFYRAIAIMLSDRLQSVINRFGRSNIAQGQPLRDVLYVLGELNDSDIDWMMAAGSPQKIPVNTTLIQQEGAVDALYLLMKGTVSVSLIEDERNPLTRAFAAIEGNETSGREIARLFKGEIIGESVFIDGRLPPATIKTLEDSLVLAIPREQMLVKIQQDIGFASRFYRVIATLLSHRLLLMYSKFGWGRHIYTQGQPLDENIEYEDELEINSLERIALAGKKFDWMRSHLRVS